MFRFIQFVKLKTNESNIQNNLPMEETRTEKNYIYCKHYKKLIVEDFALNENRENLHYGKCAIIGWCTFDRGVYFLGNIRITSSNLDLQLPENSQKVLLLTNLCKATPPIERYVEVFGESVLFDTSLEFTDDVSSIPCTTSVDLFRKRSLQEQRNGANNKDSDWSCYLPAIKVHEIVPIENAHEIINCNLRLKQIIDKT